ncbi:MAG: hypothetical protein ABFD98_08905 [Syntrophobacteraceae bacterium]|nr:carboxymuconolactone decarboxylase family protein [Desulfobacteraceae bacterium]
MFHEDIAEIRRTRKKFNHKMFQSGIGTFLELEKLEAGVFEPGNLDQKHKELIALGISISQSCYG